MLNNIANMAKVGAIKLTDIINKKFEPWEQLNSRDVGVLSDIEDLKDKFTAHMVQFFQSPTGLVNYKYPLDIGDQCLFQGLYTAMWAIRYSVTKDPSHLSSFYHALEGMGWMYYRRDNGDYIIIRGIDPIAGALRDDVSNDQATGHILGLYFAWKYGPADTRQWLSDSVRLLADELLRHDYKLVDTKGDPTPYGKLINGIQTDPLNLTLILAILKAAYKMTNYLEYDKHYHKLVKKYKPIIPYANVRLLWLEKTHHAHRAAIHYSILCDLESDHDLHRLYLKGLLRTWEMEKAAGNVWIYYLVRRHVLVDPWFEPYAINRLREFNYDAKVNQYEIDNSGAGLGSKIVKWGKYMRSKVAQPIGSMSSQDFFWQRNLFAQSGKPVQATGVKHNGGDFLLAYWGLRQLKIISD